MGHSTQGKQKEKVHSKALSWSLEPPCTVLLQGWGPFPGLYLQSCIHPQPSPNGHSCPILQMSKLTPRALKVLVQDLHLDSSGRGGKPRQLAPAAPLTTPPCLLSLWKSLRLSTCSLTPFRPLIKLHIIWKKDGVLLAGGISDYNRRLTIPNPTGSDTGYYECEAVLRSSSVPSVIRGAYLSVLGEMGQGCWGSPDG